MIGLVCILGAAMLEAVGQICFKQAAEHPHLPRPRGVLAVLHYVAAMIGYAWRNKWILGGSVCFLTEVAFVSLAMQRLPASVVAPAGTVCFVFVALLSRLWLKERVGIERWVGIGLILVGVALVSIPG
jgi:drug/metabolite transporter (DMT)-like permease